MADPTSTVPDTVIRRRETLRTVERPVHPRRIGAQVHVFPEVSVGDDVQNAGARDAREQHRQPEIDDHVGIQANPSCPKNAEAGGEDESREEEDEVGGEADVEETEELWAHGSEGREPGPTQNIPARRTPLPSVFSLSG